MQYYSREKRGMKIVSILSFVMMILVNMMAFFRWFGKKGPDEIWMQYDNLVLPHPYTMLLWVVVCLFLLYFVIFQSGKPGYGAKKDAMDTVSPIFVTICLLISAWLVLWCMDIIWLTLPIALITTGILAILYFKLGRIEPYLYQDEKKGVIYPISVLLAFVMNMTLLNFAVFVQYMKWDFFGVPRPILAIIMILLLLIINLAYIMLKRDFCFSWIGLIVMVGIVAARYLENEIMPVGYTAGLGALFILIISLNSKRKNINKG